MNAERTFLHASDDNTDATVSKAGDSSSVESWKRVESPALRPEGAAMPPELDLRDGSDPAAESSGDSGSLPDSAIGENADLPHVYPGLKRSDWMNGRPFTVTDEMMSSPWNGYRDGRTFRCHMCGEFFKPGGVARFVWCNGVKEARDAGVNCGNVMVCDACDGPDIYVRLAEHERFGQKRYWSLRDYEHLPPNPHSQKVTRARR